MADDDYKYIYTKRRVYRLPKDARGIPIEDAFPGAEMPAFLNGALVYDTPCGRIIARRPPDDSDAKAERKEDGSAGSGAPGNRPANFRPPVRERPESEPPEFGAKPDTPMPEPQ